MNEFYNERYEGLRAQFRERCLKDADQLEQKFGNAAETETVEMLLHRLAGAGATFGYPDVSIRAKALENKMIDGQALSAREQEEMLELLRGLD